MRGSPDESHHWIEWRCVSQSCEDQFGRGEQFCIEHLTLHSLLHESNTFSNHSQAHTTLTGQPPPDFTALSPPASRGPQMHQLTLTQQFGGDNWEGDQENYDPTTLPAGWREGADKISGKSCFVHELTGNVVFSRDELFKKPPAAVRPVRKPSLRPDSARTSEPRKAQ
jgi:hypothetical protein